MYGWYDEGLIYITPYQEEFAFGTNDSKAVRPIVVLKSGVIDLKQITIKEKYFKMYQICMMKLLHIIIKNISKNGLKTGIKLIVEAIK